MRARGGTDPSRKIFASMVIASLALALFLEPSFCQETNLETVQHRQVAINFSNGMMTDGGLTLPALGEGTYPGVLIVQSGIITDMDGYIPPSLFGSGKPFRPFLLIAE